MEFVKNQFHRFCHVSFREPDHRESNCKRTRECSGYLCWGMTRLSHRRHRVKPGRVRKSTTFFVKSLDLDQTHPRQSDVRRPNVLTHSQKILTSRPLSS